jgi:proteasome lid subunit RPN8/RPN11
MNERGSEKNSKDASDSEENLDQIVPNNIKKKTPSKITAFLTLTAYKRMVGYAMRYANDDMSERNWKEVYGILIGSIEDNNRILIRDAIPMVVGERAGVKYESKQYVDMAQIDESVYERSIQDKKKDFIIGWWHTHPGFKFMFSSIDVQTQLGYQIPNEYAVGLIFNHCELKSDDYFLGIAALRILNPDQGILSTYDFIEMIYEFEEERFLDEAVKVNKKVNKHIGRVLNELKFIDTILRKRYLAQLQRNYGLIMVLKEDIKVTDDENEAEEDEIYLYEWDPEFFKKRYRVPKFREKVEKEIKKYEQLLQSMENSDTIKAKKKKFSKKIKSLLKKPEELLTRIMGEFTKRVDVISPYFDYLDTNERKIIEHFEERSSEYRKILDDLQSRSEFNF